MSRGKLERTVICPGCGEVFTLDAVIDAGGACPACGYRRDNLPNRLLTVRETLDDRNGVLDGVRLSAVLRAYANLLQQV